MFQTDKATNLLCDININHAMSNLAGELNLGQDCGDFLFLEVKEVT